MAIGISNTLFILTGLCLFVILAVNAAQYSRRKHCICWGPTKYYEELGCTPVYKFPDDCCPIRFNCDQWKALPPYKCFLNGYLYERNETMRAEDKNTCDNCVCYGPGFLCTTPLCRPPRSNCYYQRIPFDCCPWREICPEKAEDRHTCIVDGKTYKDGELFVPEDEPEKHCYCNPGYAGINGEPYCTIARHTWCYNTILHAEDIRRGCAPAYNAEDSPQKDCNMSFRCQNRLDVVIRRTNEPSQSEMSDPEYRNMLCKFGNLTMRIGDELNQYRTNFANCTKCVCEIPPVPTCKYRPPEECRFIPEGGNP